MTQGIDAAAAAVADPEPSGELTRLQKAAAEAERVYRQMQSDIEREERDAARAAGQAVRQRREPELAPLRSAYIAADRARDDYVNATAGHPLEGRRVERTIPGRYSWKPDRVERGIIQVRRRDTELPDNLASYNRPSLGQAFIRAVKADGSLGSKIYERLYDNEQTEDGFRAIQEGRRHPKAWALLPADA